MTFAPGINLNTLIIGKDVRQFFSKNRGIIVAGNKGTIDPNYFAGLDTNTNLALDPRTIELL